MAQLQLDGLKNEELRHLGLLESNDIFARIETKAATASKNLQRIKPTKYLNLGLDLSSIKSNLARIIECLSCSKLNQSQNRKKEEELCNANERDRSKRVKYKMARERNSRVKQKQKKRSGYILGDGKRSRNRNRSLLSLVWLMLVSIGAIWELFSVPNETSLSLHLTRSTFQVAQATSSSSSPSSFYLASPNHPHPTLSASTSSSSSGLSDGTKQQVINVKVGKFLSL